MELKEGEKRLTLDLEQLKSMVNRFEKSRGSEDVLIEESNHYPSGVVLTVRKQEENI